MILGVQGSKNFSDYQIFLRAMGTALSMLKEGDNQLVIYSAGPANINTMSLEFSNVTERSMKSLGIKIQMKKAPASWIKSNHHILDYFVYLGRPKENLSDLATYIERKNVELGVYRY